MEILLALLLLEAGLCQAASAPIEMIQSTLETERPTHGVRSYPSQADTKSTCGGPISNHVVTRVR